MPSMILPLTFIFSFFVLPSASSSSSLPYNRRTLHHPVFPAIPDPPLQPPLPSVPKQPSSTSSFPFFPAFLSPPPPPQSTSFPVLPAVEAPPSLNSPPSTRHSFSRNLALSISLPLSSITFLIILWALFTRYRRRCSTRKPSLTETRRLFPGDAAATSVASSDFLAAPPLCSPELRPLPPLRQAEIPCPSSEDEFYSPVKEKPKKLVPANAALSNCSPSSYSLSSPSPSSQEGSPPPPPPPPPPPAAPRAAKKLPGAPPVLDGPAARTKLKPLHWDPVRASPNRVMVWDHLKGGSFQVDEAMMAALFGGGASKTTLPSPGRERRLLDPKKSQNIAILLRVLNLTVDEVCGAVIEGDAARLGAEVLETLIRMAPTREEETRLRAHSREKNSSFKLDTSEKFLSALLQIPFSFKRLEAMLYTLQFASESASLRGSFQTLKAAGEELRGSKKFKRLLEAVLKTGNRMNVGTSRGGAEAFKLDTLLKLADIKGADGKTTLLHFVVQEIVRAEGGSIAAVAGLSRELSNVKKVAMLDVETLGSAVLAGGAAKIRDVVGMEGVDGRFKEVMEGFLVEAEEEMRRVAEEESAAMTAAAVTAEYFHGSSEAAAPLRIFVVVRDFLVVLDKVCREMERGSFRGRFCDGEGEG